MISSKIYANQQSRLEKMERCWSSLLWPTGRRKERNVRQFVAIARARQERSTIQERDRLFKESHPLRFKTSSLRTE
ncbi:hypothetical protein GBAR_LOCUS16330, partial [Geodia barretti]